MFNNTTNTPNSRPEDRYYEFEATIKTNFDKIVATNTPLFTANVSKDAMWNAYISNMEGKDAQTHYECNACRHFIQRFGMLCFIDERGMVKSALWNVKVPEFFKHSVTAMRRLVETATVAGVFISDETTLGLARTGEWTHLHAKLTANHVSRNKSRVKNAGQLIAEKREDFGMLNRALVEFNLDTARQAVNILESDSLYRGDRFLGIAKWFKELKELQNQLSPEIFRNAVWMAVATAPVGYTHVKSSMIGTLLDDIQVGIYSFDELKRRFKDKMATYQRSQSAPTAGGIAQAEKLVTELGLETALMRRYAQLSEIPASGQIWTPKNKKNNAEPTPAKTGIFGNIVPKGRETATKEELALPMSTMTWEKFKRTMLDTGNVLSIEAKVEEADRLMALVTASDETAENILQWDNTFSWYYHGGVDAQIKERIEREGGKYDNNEIRCSLIWNNYTDLDLSCITPGGTRIYFGNKSSNGGTLDIDMNVSDRHSSTPVENIIFEKGRAREGKYQFIVHNYTDRNKGYNPYKLELEVEGHIYTFEGVATASYRETVFEFDYRKGQEPRMLSNSLQAVSPVENWNTSKGFQKVNMITTSPNLWEERKVEGSGQHVFFLLEGVQDSSEGKGRGFFNEMLKSELREIRKTLEQYTALTPIEGANEATACGLGFSKEMPWNLTLKVTTDTGTRLVKIDRVD
jgi:hypothetical protein